MGAIGTGIPAILWIVIILFLLGGLGGGKKY